MDDSDDAPPEIDSDFEFDDEMKQSIDNLLNIPLEFQDDSSDEEEDDNDKLPSPGEVHYNDKLPSPDDVDRNLAALFAWGSRTDTPHAPPAEPSSSTKDTGLENISDNELEGLESGECDSSDGEIPDSPSIRVTVPSTPPVLPNIHDMMDDVSDDSDVEILGSSQERNTSVEHRVTSPPQRTGETKATDREMATEKTAESGIKELKSKDRSVDGKSKDADEKNKKKSETKDDKEKKKADKLKRYLQKLDQYRSKCLEYMQHISESCDKIKKSEKSKIKQEKSKIRHMRNEDKLKSDAEAVQRDRETSPQSSSSSKLDQISSSSRSSRKEANENRKSDSSEKDKKLKSLKRPRSKSTEFKEHKLKYQRYLHYLHSEREKCFEENSELDRHKHKKRKRRKSKSSSPEKNKEKSKYMSPVLSFADFCSSRELISPAREIKEDRVRVETPTKINHTIKKTRNMSVGSFTTSSSVQSDPKGITADEDDKELFVTYSDLVQQDNIDNNNQQLEGGNDKFEKVVDKNPELKSFSVFTSVLFKGSMEPDGIPFLAAPPSPEEIQDKPPKSKIRFIDPSGPDDIYDQDLSSISQSSLSPSRSPVPKVHNKSLFNFLENQKESEKRKERNTTPKREVNSNRSHSLSKSPVHRSKSPTRRSKSPTTRSTSPVNRPKSPRKDVSLRSKRRRRHHHSSYSPSPPPPPNIRARSPVGHKRASPTAHLKDRWRDYPSPPAHSSDRKRDSRPLKNRRRSRSRQRVRVGHRSRSSSGEPQFYRRHRSRSRSPPPSVRSRSRSRSKSISRSSSPTQAMVQLSTQEKRRKIKEEHEKALASLRASLHKPLSTKPFSITFNTDPGDNFLPVIENNYDPVVMNEVREEVCSVRTIEVRPPPPAGMLPNGSNHAVTTHTYYEVTNYTEYYYGRPLPPYQYHPYNYHH